MTLKLAAKIEQSVVIRDCGPADYRQILQLQLQLWRQRRDDEAPDTVLLVEHTPVITLGARRSANRLHRQPEELQRGGIDVVQIRRGGGTTAHNPGQIVFYPIIHLQQRKLGVSEYVRLLEEIGIELLDELGVSSDRRKGYPGLWVNGRKIASVGVRVSKMVTYHGMAVNVRNDLGIFDWIVPCGLDAVEMTSVLRETGVEHSMEEVKAKLRRILLGAFSV